MENRIYIRELVHYKGISIDELKAKYVAKNPYYDLSELPSGNIKEEVRAFLLDRSKKVDTATFYAERTRYRKICRFLSRYAKNINSLADIEKEVWMKKLKAWMFQEGIEITKKRECVYGTVVLLKTREFGYLDAMLDFVNVQEIPEREKDIWKLEKLDIPYKDNLIKSSKTINFTGIPQKEIREEVKTGIYLNLQGEAIACVQKEMTAMRRLSKYLKERYPRIQSCKELEREIIEEYLTYLKTEATETKHFHADINRLRAVLESIGHTCGYQNLSTLFLTRDIPPTPKAEFKVYSDEELKRLNAAIVKMDEQTARLMVIHQMLGTRISDTLTLETDCLYEKGIDTIIRIRQMKTSTYEKPVSAELAALIRKAIAYTQERFGETQYIFVNENNPNKPMQYGTIQSRIVKMIREQNIRDDNGNLFGFGSHLYRHYYGVKLTEMHLDDWTIAKLLGHSNLKNVKYYRKMSNQILADDTRKARKRLSDIILQNLDGWGDEYEQIRQDGGM